ncbi:hypothetical protein [Aliarcobacter butzleri]|uniref:hypothetical protein n=1 Tax=Aliarcobacter butzleri TaxID=28197 RepID=UPI003AF6BC17
MLSTLGIMLLLDLKLSKKEKKAIERLRFIQERRERIQNALNEQLRIKNLFIVKDIEVENLK